MSTAAIPYDIEPRPETGMYNGKFGIWLFLASEVMLFGALFSTYVLLRVGAPAGTWPRGDSILNVPLATLNTMVLITSSVTMVLSWASLKMGNFKKGQVFLTLTFLLAGVFLVIKYFEYKAKLTHYAVYLKEPMMLPGEKEPRPVITGHLEEGGPVLETDAKTGAFAIPEAVHIHPDPPKGSHEHPPAAHVPGEKIVRVTTFGPRHSNYLAIYFTLTGLHGLHIVGGMVVILYFMLRGASNYKRNHEKYINRIECTGLYWHFVDLVWIFLFPVLYLL